MITQTAQSASELPFIYLIPGEGSGDLNETIYSNQDLLSWKSSIFRRTDLFVDQFFNTLLLWFLWYLRMLIHILQKHIDIGKSSCVDHHLKPDRDSNSPLKGGIVHLKVDTITCLCIWTIRRGNSIGPSTLWSNRDCMVPYLYPENFRLSS